LLSGVTTKHAGWLSKIIRENIVKEKEKAGDEIESELNVCFFYPTFSKRETDRSLKIR